MPEPEQLFTVGQVTDVGGIDDKSFNQTAWKGVQDAMEELGVEGVFLESQQQTDYEKNLNEFLSQNKDLIITVGFLLADATKAAAEANPDAKFAIIDSASSAPNVKGLLFDVAQPSFLAGYLAAGMSETGTVCTYGGLNIPPVAEFMIGYQNGVNYYNAQNGAEVQLLGWDNAANDGVFTGNFEFDRRRPPPGRELLRRGLRRDLPGGRPGRPGQRGRRQGPRPDDDRRGQRPVRHQRLSSSDVFLSSVLKNMDKAVFDTIAALVDGSLTLGDDYLGTLANGGVGLAPSTTSRTKVSAELTAEIEQVIAGHHRRQDRPQGDRLLSR